LAAKVVSKGRFGRPIALDEYGQKLDDREALKRFMLVRYLTREDFSKFLGNRWKPRAVRSWLEGQCGLPTDVLVAMQERLESERADVLRHRLPRMPSYNGGRDRLANVIRELMAE
jgi:hypothetical protein